MNEHVSNYVKTEKDLAKYNILMLERGEITPARKRLIRIEQEFIDTPFDKLGLQTIEEVTEAINLFRQSRGLFYLKYKIDNSTNTAEKISKKTLFLEKVSTQLKLRKIQQINVVQDKFFYQELVKYFAEKNKISTFESSEILKNRELKDLQIIEPAIIAKKRARLQNILYSLGSAIQFFLDEELNLDKESNYDFNLVNSKIDNFIFNLDKYAFKFYNKSLDSIADSLKSSMGDNKYLDRIYSLDNIFSLYENTDTHKVYRFGDKKEIDISTPQIRNLYLNYKNSLYYSYQKDADKKVKNKVYGILFPIERTSREKMTSLYTEIYCSGINITELFSNQISNIRVINQAGKKIYYKGIFMKPLWQLLNYASECLEYHYIISNLLGENLNDISKFNDERFIKYINQKETPLLKIDMTSKILIPKTRSEEQYLDDIYPLLSQKINDIKNDYKNII